MAKQLAWVGRTLLTGVSVVLLLLIMFAVEGAITFQHEGIRIIFSQILGYTIVLLRRRRRAVAGMRVSRSYFPTSLFVRTGVFTIIGFGCTMVVVLVNTDSNKDNSSSLLDVLAISEH
jgi:hypothetical protein